MLNFKVNQGAYDKKAHKVAVVSPFMTLGLEEWVTGNDNYITSCRCTNSYGIIEDRDLVEIFKNYYGEKD